MPRKAFTLAEVRQGSQHVGVEQAIAAFVEAEASMEDPVEGRPETDSGPVRKEIQRLPPDYIPR